MTRQQTYQAILGEVAHCGDRSPLFWFLVEQHDELVEHAAGKRMRWDTLCKHFAEHGLTDRRGAQATPETARKTWQRARQFVAQVRARKQAADALKKPGQTYPSNRSPDWRPEVVPQTPGVAQRQAMAQHPVVASPMQLPVPASGPVPGSPPTALAPQDDGPDLSRFDEVGRARVKAMRESILGQLSAISQKIYGS
jgi:hypothetical protein